LAVASDELCLHLLFLNIEFVIAIPDRWTYGMERCRGKAPPHDE